MVDIFPFLIENLNPTMLDQNFHSDIERNYTKMLWEHCIPRQLCKFVYLKYNFTQLCQPQITFQKANDAVKDFIQQEDVNIELLRKYLEQYAVIYQFLYANLFSKVYVRNTQFGKQNKAIFEYTYREWYAAKTNKRSISNSSGGSSKEDQVDGSKSSSSSSETSPTPGKNPEIYEQRQVVNKFEQRPEEIKFGSSVAVGKNT